MGSRDPDAPCIGGRVDSARETRWGFFACSYDFAAAQTEDNNGNTLSESTASPAAVTSYTWDRDNRLRLVTPPSPGLPTSYAYDANGLRIQRVDSTGNVNYLLDGPSVLEELDGALATTTRYLNNPRRLDEIISVSRAGVTAYPLTDAQGSIYAVTDSTGALVHRYDFEVYGVRSDLGGSGVGLDIGFTGRWHDANGLLEHRDRQRRPDVGGWLQPDRNADGVNRYLYAKNRPTRAIDPTGQKIIISLDDQYGTLQSALKDVKATPLGALYVQALEDSPVVFNIYSDPSLEGKFGQTGDPDPDVPAGYETRTPGHCGFVDVRVNLNEIRVNNQHVLPLVLGIAPGLQPHEVVTPWGILGHELFHALDYVDGFPPNHPELEYTSPGNGYTPPHSYPEKFEEYVEQWTLALQPDDVDWGAVEQVLTGP